MVKRKRDENKIIVVGLPEGTDGEALEAMFAGVGKIYAAHVVGYEPTTGKSRGYGFVTFAEESSCLAAVQAMHKTVVEGRTINVRLVEDRGDHTKAVLEPGKGVGVGKDANKVLVAGLSQTMTDERLQLICEEFGLVLKATVVCHPVTGKSKGFGFVTFTNRACQQACIAKLDKRELGGGRVLNVRAVETRVPEAASAADGGAGGSNLDMGSGAKDDANAGNAKKKTAAGVAESAEEAAKPVCLKYQTNKCHRGRACRWRHVKVSDAKAHNEKLAAATAAAEVLGGAKVGSSSGNKETATAIKRGAKKGWGGEAIEPKTAGDLGSESEAEDDVAGSSSNSRRDDQAPTNATAKAGNDESNKVAKKKADPADILPATSEATKPAKAATSTTELGGWSDESEDEESPVSTKESSNVVSFSDDDDDEDNGNGNSMAAMSARANSGTVAFDDGDDDEDGGDDNKDAKFQSTNAFDSDSDDSHEAPIFRDQVAAATDSRSNGKSKAKGAAKGAAKGDEIAAVESNRETMQAEASQALSIMASLFPSGAGNGGASETQKKPTVKRAGKKNGAVKRGR